MPVTLLSPQYVLNLNLTHISCELHGLSSFPPSFLPVSWSEYNKQRLVYHTAWLTILTWPVCNCEMKKSPRYPLVITRVQEAVELTVHQVMINSRPDDLYVSINIYWPAPHSVTNLSLYVCVPSKTDLDFVATTDIFEGIRLPIRLSNGVFKVNWHNISFK